ncbi:hypothetical protein GW17_00045744 [Ensete ventricosum]|nr:hypothetical protein GW17_00045744 [Ensete ventricosum]
MIAGYVRCGLQAQALEVYEEMQTAGWRPDEAALVSLLSSCSNSGSVDTGQKIHSSSGSERGDTGGIAGNLSGSWERRARRARERADSWDCVLLSVCFKWQIGWRPGVEKVDG